MKKIGNFIILLQEVIMEAEEEKKNPNTFPILSFAVGDGFHEADKIYTKEEKIRAVTFWSLGQLNSVILEMKELLTHAKNGEVFFKHGRKQRTLQSTYLIPVLSNSPLSEKIHQLQQLYNRL